ncbi:MAG: hypothetical protein ACKOWF_09490 [Chloroflexota bacterium]
MDHERFASLSRAVAASTSRRATVRALLGLGAAGVTVAGVSAKAGTSGIPIVSCKVPGELCQGDKACCSGRCKGGICTCVRKGRRCWEPAEGALCCSGRCHKGTCK